MKVAFDATVLYGRKSGVGYYCEELLKAMLAIEHEMEFFVFSHLPITAGISSNGNVRFSDSKFLPIRALYLQALLPQILGVEKPDLCHYTNFLAPIRQDAPYVVTIHDMTLELASAHPPAKRLYTRRLLPGVARRARKIITVSEHSKWEIVRFLGISADRIAVIPLAASLEFHPIEGSERKPILDKYRLKAPYFLYVGNLEPRKNLPGLIEAFAGLNHRDHELVIIGKPWYRGSDAIKAAKACGVAPRVRFLGYIERTDLPALYSGATALAYPSLSEGFGLPVIEAMACGAPVVTSNTSSLKETAGEAALLVDPTDVWSIRQALCDVAEDRRLAASLTARGLARAKEYSWDTTAALTLDVYHEAVEPARCTTQHGKLGGHVQLDEAIERTLTYSAMFQYPLTLDELRDRLFEVTVDAVTLDRVCRLLGVPRTGEFIAVDSSFVATRRVRETISDRAIQEVWPHLKTLSTQPFIRMIAFSGATAHRNMTSAQDVDLFIIVEDGKLWSAFLIAVIWAKLKGLRRRLCMNYLITTASLPLFEHDVFTAQQVASLKPIFGKSIYDAFVESNSFVRTYFPNFERRVHREMYPEIRPSRTQKLFEAVLRCGAVQVGETLSRWLLGKHLRRKADQASARGIVDVLLERRRLKLHMNSHKQEVLESRVTSQSR